MSAKHTPEPWIADDFAEGDGLRTRISLPDHNGIPNAAIAYVQTNKTPDWPSEQRITATQAEANAARIVACINACTGLEDPAAELAALKAQRDELLAALKALADEYADPELAMEGPAYAVARATIAKVQP